MFPRRHPRAAQSHRGRGPVDWRDLACAALLGLALTGACAGAADRQADALAAAPAAAPADPRAEPAGSSATDGGGAPAAASAAAVAAEDWNLHGQFTAVEQAHPGFHAPYSGANSLAPGGSGKETVDLTLFGGARLWHGAALYVDPEIDQGFGLSDTLGVAGFTSGEAYKVGARNPYFRLPRAFLRQVWSLDDDGDPAAGRAESGQNQLAGALPEQNVTLTVGKLSVVDIFDRNRYANDSKSDFLNWSIINSGAFDYPADAWAFTYGAALEWTSARYTLRGGAFALSKVPNSKDIDGTFDQFGLIAELEERHEIAGLEGKARLLGFVNRGRMGRYDDALALAHETGSAPDTALVRRYASRPGGALNLEQALDGELGAFARLSANEGAQEAFEFTEINRSLALGLATRGGRWQRADDKAGVALVVNGLSSAARDYFSAGGYGILIGDGRLDYGLEHVLEAYYNAALRPHLTLSGDFQFVDHPAYNRDRGPVSVLAVRIHAEF
jgi:high affinity Mn2+ porin